MDKLYLLSTKVSTDFVSVFSQLIPSKETRLKVKDFSLKFKQNSFELFKCIGSVARSLTQKIIEFIPKIKRILKRNSLKITRLKLKTYGILRSIEYRKKLYWILMNVKHRFYQLGHFFRYSCRVANRRLNFLTETIHDNFSRYQYIRKLIPKMIAFRFKFMILSRKVGGVAREVIQAVQAFPLSQWKLNEKIQFRAFRGLLQPRKSNRLQKV